jgi:hypothetical protein
MNKQEADRLQLALDGVSANIETIRSLIAGMVVEPAIEPIVEEWKPVSNECRHIDIREISTMGNSQRFCNDCGYEL